MCPLDRFNCSSSALKFTIMPLLAVSILEWTAFPLSANTVSRTSMVDSQPAHSTSSASLSKPKNSAHKEARIKGSPNVPSTGQRRGGAVTQSSPAPEPIESPELPDPPETSEPAEALPPASEEEMVTVPKSSAIIVSFPAEIMLDPQRQHNVPITLPLVRPIVDVEGNVVVPAKALVSAQLKPMKGGDLVEVIAVVIGGRVVPINAIGTLVPAQKKPEDFANQYVPNPGPLNNVFNSLSNWQLSSTYLNLNKNARLNDYIGIGLAVANGLTTPKPKDPPAYVSIAQGTTYILTLATPFRIPKKLVDTGIQLEQNAEEIGAQ